MKTDFDKLVLNGTPDAMIAATLEGTVLYWNPAAQDIFGYTSDEALGRTLNELVVPPDRIQEERRIIDEALAADLATYESIRRRKDGSLIYVDVSSRAIRNAEGKAELILSSQKDVTHLRVLRDSKLIEARFRDLFESTPDAILMANITGRMVLANGHAEKLFGYERRELLGQPVELLLPHRFRQGHVGRRSAYFAHPRARAMGADLELYGLRKDGSEFPVEISLSPLDIGEGAIVMSAIRDITEHKHFEQVRASRERLQVLSRQLMNLQEAERRHIARELHDEIGQALTAVNLNLKALQQPGAATAPAVIQESIGILDHTLRQVRNLALDLRPSMLDDLGLVAALRWYLDRQAQRAGFVADFVAEPAEFRAPKELETACFRVAQEALTNIARHATAKHVRLELYHHDAELHFRIRDDGVGFDVAAARQSAARGQSLGLLGMEERVVLLGGQFEIDSAPSHGTEVRVRFPLGPSRSRETTDETKDGS